MLWASCSTQTTCIRSSLSTTNAGCELCTSALREPTADPPFSIGVSTTSLLSAPWMDPMSMPPACPLKSHAEISTRL